MTDPKTLTGRKLLKYNEKMEVFHQGMCSSPYYKGCPCPRDCPLHGRCCDCVHHHIAERKEIGTPAEDTNWLVECIKLAHEGKFDEIYINVNEERVQANKEDMQNHPEKYVDQPREKKF